VQAYHRTGSHLPGDDFPVRLDPLPPTSAADLLTALCEGRQVVIVRPRSDVPPACAGRLVLTGDDFARGGAAELYRTHEGWRVAWAADVRGRRPWTSGSGE